MKRPDRSLVLIYIVLSLSKKATAKHVKKRVKSFQVSQFPQVDHPCSFRF